MIEDLAEAFERHSSNFKRKFKDIEKPLASRPDLHAFMLLDRLVPMPSKGQQDMIGGAEHDIIFLTVNEDALARVATDDDIRDLAACGVFISQEYGGLCMFV